MKTIGLIGGMSWTSTVAYYRRINLAAAERLGGWHSAKCLLYSVDFGPIEQMQRTGDWQAAGRVLADAARSLERGGAECIALCTNTMHKVSEAIEAAVGLPLLHIADATAAAIQEVGLERVGLLGTRFTMEEDFYRERLKTRQGISVLVPDAAGRDVVDAMIYEELCREIIRDESRARLHAVIDELRASGAQGVVLGCTELGLLADPATSALPLFDTTVIHADAIVRFALDAS